MKKFFKKAAVVLLAAVFLTGMYSSAFAATKSKVVVHVQDGASWGSMNVYNWGDDGETAGAWPGTAMKSEGNSWYTYTFETKCDLNLVFTAKAGKPQSSNLDKITPDAGEVWVVIGGKSAGANDMGADTVQATLYTKAKSGWPTVAAKDTAKTSTSKSSSSKTSTTKTSSSTATTSTDTTTSAPKTGESQTLAFAYLGLAALSAAAVVVLRRKERTSEN